PTLSLRPSLLRIKSLSTRLSNGSGPSKAWPTTRWPVTGAISKASRAGCTRESLYRYLGDRSAKGGRRGTGYTARSNARLISTLRHFYRLRLRIGAITADPTVLLEAPKLPRPLPKALSEGEV